MLDGLIFKLFFGSESLGGMLLPCFTLSFRYSILEILDLLWTETSNGASVLGFGEVRPYLAEDGQRGFMEVTGMLSEQQSCSGHESSGQWTMQSLKARCPNKLNHSS